MQAPPQGCNISHHTTVPHGSHPTTRTIPHLLDAGLEPRDETLDTAPGRGREEGRPPEACLGESARRPCRPRATPPPPLPLLPAATNRCPRPSPHPDFPFGDGLRPLLVPPLLPTRPTLCCARLDGKEGRTAVSGGRLTTTAAARAESCRLQTAGPLKGEFAQSRCVAFRFCAVKQEEDTRALFYSGSLAQS